MSYQVLARKWRPQRFEDVVGQGHITRTLQNAIASNRLAHAFLFSGPRGVGKTTTARILAKALNCAEGPTPNPCGKCSSCLETTAGTSVDVIEIDGASNRGIEHIRELREAVKYAPAGGKNKVYVIDEVHMLTNEAFNALLKTLEEPPPHVTFIFATTEPQKIPATIHSRCQRYGFKRIALGEIISTLRDIAGREGITISDQGLGMIAKAAEGSMRDSQSLLDQAVSYSGTTIRDEDLQLVLSVVPQTLLLAFAGSLLAKDSPALLKQVDALLEQGQDMRQFLSGVVEHLRNLIVARTARDPARLIELPAADVEALKQQAANAGPEQLLLLFDSLSRTLDEMRGSPHQRFTFEVGLIKACSLAPLRPLGEVLGELKDLEARLGTGMPQQGGIVRDPGAAYHVRKPPVSSPGGSRSSEPPGAGDLWGRIVSAVKERKASLASMLLHGKILENSGETLVAGIKGGGFQLGQVENRENKALIEQAAAAVLNRPVALQFQPLAEEPRHSGKKTSAPKRSAPDENDPAVQDVLDVFGGEVVDQDEP